MSHHSPDTASARAWQSSPSVATVSVRPLGLRVQRYVPASPLAQWASVGPVSSRNRSAAVAEAPEFRTIDPPLWAGERAMEASPSNIVVPASPSMMSRWPLIQRAWIALGSCAGAAVALGASVGDAERLGVGGPPTSGAATGRSRNSAPAATRTAATPIANEARDIGEDLHGS